MWQDLAFVLGLGGALAYLVWGKKIGRVCELSRRRKKNYRIMYGSAWGVTVLLLAMNYLLMPDDPLRYAIGGFRNPEWFNAFEVNQLVAIRDSWWGHLQWYEVWLAFLLILPTIVHLRYGFSLLSRRK